MKDSIVRKSFIAAGCIVAYMLLGGFICCCGAQVTVVRPPENVTVCSGVNVTISCGYQSNSTLNVTWVINGELPVSDTALNNYTYQLNNRDDPVNYSLTILDVNNTNGTYQCIIESSPNTTTTSTLATVNVTEPFVMITEIVGGCGYVSFSWTDSSSGMCTDYYYYYVTWSNRVTNITAFISAMQYNLTDQPDDALIDITVYAALQSDADRTPTSNVASTSVRTLPFERPNPIMVATNISFSDDMVMITVTWQAPVINTSCTANIIMYNITVMDQRSSESVTVPANVSSVEISEFPNNDTAMVANSEYTITVSAISDQETSYPSDPVVVSTAVAAGTSDSAGTRAGGVIAGITAAIITLAIVC